MDGDGMITKDELKKLVEKVCKTYFSYIRCSYKYLSILYLGWRKNDWGRGQGPDSPGRQGEQSEAIILTITIDQTQDGNESIDFSEFSKLWAAIKGEGEVGLKMSGGIFLLFFVIYLLGTRRTPAPAFIIFYFLLKPQRRYWQHVCGPGLCQSWNKASLTVLLLPHFSLALSSQSEAIIVVIWPIRGGRDTGDMRWNVLYQ